MWTAEKIKELRNSLGETQSEFAERLGVTIWTVRSWEQGKNPPSGAVAVLLDMVHKRHEPQQVELMARELRRRLNDLFPEGK